MEEDGVSSTKVADTDQMYDLNALSVTREINIKNVSMITTLCNHQHTCFTF